MAYVIDYDELKSWQQGIGALLGFMALMIAALWNFRLNRKRDRDLREHEAKAVAAALYGEMRLLREGAADVARSVAQVYIMHGTNERSAMKFDKHFAEAHRIAQPMLYNALASKFGLLPAGLILKITQFYANIQAVGDWLPRMADDPDRGYSYGILYVLQPAHHAVVEGITALREIETLVLISPDQSAKELDLGKADGLIAHEKAELEAMSQEDSP